MFLPLWSKGLKNSCKGVNYLVGAAHRAVTYENFMFFSGICPGFCHSFWWSRTTICTEHIQ